MWGWRRDKRRGNVLKGQNLWRDDDNDDAIIMLFLNRLNYQILPRPNQSSGGNNQIIALFNRK